MDLLLPMEGSVAATASDWGTTAGENTQYAGTWEGTLGRWKDNGIEDTERSYWGGNIIQGDDGRYHIYVAGWPSATCGHMQWSSRSRVYHVVSDNVWGPYTYVSDIGGGHNPEIYKTGDTYIIYRIQPLGYYKSTTLGDTWESGTYTFDLRGRAIVAGDNRETSLSNCSFAKREDGSFVMIDRGGGIWVSRDGLDDPWHQLTDASVYLNSEIKNRGSLEDPVIWRDHLQYHMVVNDWRARYAYYYRSLDGLHWTKEAGKAYTGQDPFARHSDGTVEQWHKYERPRIYQDELGRAIRMNFAVIDCVKQSDLAGDNHSSKNINMPLTRQLLLEVQTLSSTSATVLVKAEEGFNPKTDLDFATLKFGSHNKVNYGNGFSYASHADSGDDVIINFTGSAGAINAGEWAPKMLGQKTDGTVAFGYARMPDVNYQPAILSAVMPQVDEQNHAVSVMVANYGQSQSETTQLRVLDQSGNILSEGEIAPIAAYDSLQVVLTPKRAISGGTSALAVVFRKNNQETDRNTLSAADIVANQAILKELTDSASTLLTREDYTEGRDALQQAINEAKKYADRFSLAETAAAITALKKAIRNFLFANGNVTESYDFYSWAMTANASLAMTTQTVTVKDGATTLSVPIADYVTDGTNTQHFNGRLAFSQGGSNFNLRNNGVNNASSGLFDYNKDSYFCILNLNPGDKVSIRVTGLPLYFVSTNVCLQSDASQTAVASGSEVTSDATYVVLGSEGQKVRLDLKGVHYTTIKLVTIETSEKERIAPPTCSVTGAYYNQRTVTIVPGMGSAGTDAEATYYTTDGTTPGIPADAPDASPVGILYTAPFVVNETTTVKAISYLPDMTPSEVSETVISAGTTLSLNTPTFQLDALSGNQLSPVVSVTCDNSSVIGMPDATVVFTFHPAKSGENGEEVQVPFTFTEDGTLQARVLAEGYEEASASITLAGSYEEQHFIDYTAITAANIKSVLGSSWAVGTQPTRWAYWSTGDTYYVAYTSEIGDIHIGDRVMTDQGKSLLMGYGIGRNTTNGETRFWIDQPQADAIALYEVNETRDNSGRLTPYYVLQANSSTLEHVINTNYTLAKAHVYMPVSSKPTGISVQQAPAAPRSVYNLKGQRIATSQLKKGLYIVRSGAEGKNGKKVIQL